MRAPTVAVLALGWLAACSASRSDEIGSECISDRQCGSGAVCESGLCTSTNSESDSASVTGKVVGAPDGVTIDSETSGDQSCEQRAGKGLACTLDPGGKVTLIAAQVEGYRFKGWTGKNGCESSERKLVLKKVERSTTCTANYVKRVHVSGAVAGEDGARVLASSDSPFASCAEASCEIDVGGTVVLAAPERDGFRIVAFEGDGCADRQGYRVTVSAAEDDVLCIASYIDSFTVRGQIQGVAAETQRAVESQIKASSPAESALCEGQVCAIDPGNVVTLVAPQIDAYRFRGWTGDAPCLGSELTVEIVDVTTNVLCTADYVARFDVKGESEGADAPIRAVSENLFSSCDGAGCTVDSGESVTLHAGSVDGYRLKSWSGKGCEALSGASAIARSVTDDVTCVAHYVEGVSITGTVVNAEGEVDASSDSPGADCERGSCAVDIGGSATLVAPSLPGRTFLGWSGDPGCSGTAPTLTLDNVTTSKSCNATFAARYTVSTRAEPAAGGQVAASSSAQNAACSGVRCEVDEGSTVTLNATTNTGYRFTGWSGGGPCVGLFPRLDLTNVTASVTCNGNFVKRIAVSGTVSPSNAGTVRASQLSLSSMCSGSSCTVDAGTDVLLTASAASGWKFVSWSGCGSRLNPLLGDNLLPVLGPTADTSCTATFEKITYLVSALPSTGGSVGATTNFGSCVSAMCTVEDGGSAQLTATPDGSHDFAGWTGCSVGSSGTVSNVKGPVTCTATFKLKQVTLTGSASPGSVTASSPGKACSGPACTVDYGSSVTLTVGPDPTGYRFDRWRPCTGATISGRSLTVSSLMSSYGCSATFTMLRSFTVTTKSVGPGTASCDGPCTVYEGQSVTLKATFPNDSTFSGWKCEPNVSMVGNTINNLQQNVTCTATFMSVLL